MIVINEILPNPTGKDTGNEWIELYNQELTPINIVGWYLKTANGKKTYLHETLGGGAYKTLSQKQYKFTLRNTGEYVSLYDANGRLQDRVQMIAQAPEQKSFSRTPDNMFVFTTPTPGAKNNLQALADAKNINLPYGTQLNASITATNTTVLALATAIAVACAVVYIVRVYDIPNPLAQRHESQGS